MKKKPISVVFSVLIATVIAVDVYPLMGGEKVSALFFGGTSNEAFPQVKSPDGHSIAILSHKAKHGLARPPEPPKTLERWSRLEVLRDRKTVYDSGFENLNVYQTGAGLALDVAWSPNSSHLAYRHITLFRIVDRDGKANTYDAVPEEKDSVISSFRWIDNERLLVVSKKARYPLGMHGKPYFYNGYTDQATSICIALLHLTKGRSQRYQQTVNGPTFLFHAIDFCLDEISPKADRVAFSDGDSLCIYDDSANKLVAHIKIPQKPAPKPNLPADYPSDAAKAVEELSSKPAQLDGIWWQTNDKLLIGVGLLGFPPKAFYTFDIPSKVLTDKSSVLLPAWLGSEKTRNYQDPDWFRSKLADDLRQPK